MERVCVCVLVLIDVILGQCIITINTWFELNSFKQQLSAPFMYFYLSLDRLVSVARKLNV